ncbi:MAG: phytanoyl-CoA dioxygenase family protein [Pirellulales bacterium]
MTRSRRSAARSPSWQIRTTRPTSYSTSSIPTSRTIRRRCCSTPWGLADWPGAARHTLASAHAGGRLAASRRAVRFWHDQLFCKPPRHGGVVAWHQDYSYWTRTVPLAHLTCWIGLDDADEQSGCVQYIPGSHRWNLLPITGLAGDMHAIREVLSDEQWEAFRPVKVELRRGECVFHHALTIHGSEANRSDHPRRAVVVNMVRDGVVSDSNEPLLAGVPVVPLGEPLGGQFFPLLFDPESIE